MTAIEIAHPQHVGRLAPCSVNTCYNFTTATRACDLVSALRFAISLQNKPSSQDNGVTDILCSRLGLLQGIPYREVFD